MGMAGASMVGGSNATLRSQMPFSFKASVDQLEDEINNLRQELAFCKKEVQILKTEQDTVEEVATAQSNDIERYLSKENNLLNDVINKFSIRQKAENTRFQVQVSQCRQILNDLEDNRLECVRNVR
jgi:chromosome segregation ATPase